MDNTQRATGILEDVYLQGLEKAQRDSFAVSKPDQTTEAILISYQHLIKEFPPDRLENLGEVPDQLWEGLRKIGVFGLNIPTKYGGKGLPLDHYLKILETIARQDLSLAIIPTAHLSIGLKGILLFGTEAQKKQYLPKAASGEMLFAYALTEPNTGSDARHIETQATLSDDKQYYLLNGTKTYITNGGYAGGLTVFAQLDPDRPGFMGAFIVETGWEGVKIGKPMAKMGLTISSTTSISFKDVKVPVANLLGKPGDGFKIAMTILNYGRLGLGAASVGVMNQAIADMLHRASTRHQFGVPINNFELVQEKIVRGRVNSFATEAMTYLTAHLLHNTPLANVAMESSHTKLFGTTRAWDTLYDALQTAGGAGYITTLPYEKRLRDFRVATIFEGTTEIHSIYPPLHLLRILGKQMKRKKGGKVRQLLFLMAGLLPWKVAAHRYADPIMNRAGKTISRHVRAVRRQLYLGMLRYGKEMVQRQFYLRRITRLSVKVYAMLAMLRLIEAEQRQGKDVQEKLQLLDYFVEEAQENFRQEKRCCVNKEKLHHKIFQALANAGSGKE